MFPVFALIFLIVPVVEIYFLIQVGQVIGALWTVFFVVLTAVIGVQLLKTQGISTLSRAQQKMNSGEMPATEMVEGIALLIAGAFLLTPGFFTDTIGFLLLIPATRKLIVSHLFSKIISSAQFSSINAEVHSHQSKPSDTKKGDVIEGVKYRKDDE